MNFLNFFQRPDPFLWDFIGYKLLNYKWNDLKNRDKVATVSVDQSLPIFDNRTFVFDKTKLPFIFEIIKIVSDRNGVLSGGAVLSAIHSDKVNDIDCYFDNYNDFASTISTLMSTLSNQFNISSKVRYILQSPYAQSFFMKNKILCVARLEFDVPLKQKVELILCADNKFEVIRNFDLSFCSIWWSPKEGVGAYHLSDTLSKKGKLHSDYFQYLVNKNPFIMDRLEKYTSKGYEINIECKNRVTIKQDEAISDQKMRLLSLLRKLIFDNGIEKLIDTSIYKILYANTLDEFIYIVLKYQENHMSGEEFDNDFLELDKILSEVLQIVVIWISSKLSLDLYHLPALLKAPRDIDFRVLKLLMQEVYKRKVEETLPLLLRRVIIAEEDINDIEYDFFETKLNLTDMEYEAVATEVVKDFMKMKQEKIYDYSIKDEEYHIFLYKNLHILQIIIDEFFQYNREMKEYLTKIVYSLRVSATIVLSEYEFYDTICDIESKEYEISKEQLKTMPLTDVIMYEDTTALKFLEKKDDDAYGDNIIFINLSEGTPVAFGGRSSDFLNVRYENMFMPCFNDITFAPYLNQVEEELYIRPALDIFRTCIPIGCWKFIRSQIRSGQRIFTFNDRKQIPRISSVLTIKLSNEKNIFGEDVNIVSSAHCNDGIYYYETVGVVKVK